MSMMPPNSPLFTALQLVSSTPGGLNAPEPTLLPQLPEKPTASSGSLQMYIIPTEKNLFFQGFDANEYSERQPILLRGCLFLRVLKPAKIKSISLTFQGNQRTDWPEGIPPKKTVFVEETDIISHTWPFYSMSNPMNTVNGGADHYSELPKNLDRDVSHLSLNDSGLRSHSPSINQLDPNAPGVGAANGGGGTAAGLFRSMSPAIMRNGNSSPSLNPVDSFTDLQTVNTGDSDPGKPGIFPPGDYIYNFEHPLRPSLPETTSVTFGEVNYGLEATVIRAGAFKLNLTGKIPITLVRTPSELNMEENEPIVITRDWEDQLRYDIVIGGKSIVLDSYLPLAFRFVPLWGKVALHRIRVYLSENLEYYCQNKKVHRTEPPKKYLLLEHKAKKGKSLLARKDDGEYGDENDELLPRELEFQLYVPQTLNGRVHHVLHPDTSFDDIQAHHWIKLCLRISKMDPNTPGKRKHYEILIDSPIHILSPLAAHGNTLLPAYDDHLPESSFLPEYAPASPPLSPGVTPVDNTQTIGKLFSVLSNSSSRRNSVASNVAEPPAQNEVFHHLNSNNNNDEPIERDPDMHLDANIYKPAPGESRSQFNSPQAMPHAGSFSPLNSPTMRPIHLLRKPSFNPPPFEADAPPPDMTAPPPAYEEEPPASSPLSTNNSSSSGLSTRGRSRASSGINRANLTQMATGELSIRDLLTNSFSANPHRDSITSKKSQSSGDTDKSKDTLKSDPRKPDIITQAPDLTKPLDPIDPGMELMAPAPETLDPMPGLFEEEDIVNLVKSPELIPQAVSPRRHLSPVGSPRNGVSPIASPIRGVSPVQSRRNSAYEQGPALTLNESNRNSLTNLNDQSSVESSSSRRTSIASETSNDFPMGQHIPLLNLSTQSLLTSNPPNTRTASIGSILFDPSSGAGRRLSSNTRPMINDFVDGGDLGSDFMRGNGKLLQFTNPRRRRKDESKDTPNEEAVDETEEAVDDAGQTVIETKPVTVKRTSSSESDLTINETNHINNHKSDTSQIPGLKFDYVIE